MSWHTFQEAWGCYEEQQSLCLRQEGWIQFALGSKACTFVHTHWGVVLPGRTSRQGILDSFYNQLVHDATKNSIIGTSFERLHCAAPSIPVEKTISVLSKRVFLVEKHGHLFLRHPVVAWKELSTDRRLLPTLLVHVATSVDLLTGWNQRFSGDQTCGWKNLLQSRCIR